MQDPPWYRDSASAVAEGIEKRNESITNVQDPPWYRDSASAVAEGLEKRDESITNVQDPPWYRDSAASVADGVEKRDETITNVQDPPWYRDSAAAVAEGVEKRGESITNVQDPPWYRDSAAAVAEGVEKRDESITNVQDPPWYRDSASAVAEGIEKRDESITNVQDPPWYRDSASSVAEGLEKRDESITNVQDPPWYRDSAATVSEGIEKRDSFTDKSNAKMEALRREVFGNMRNEQLRSTSEKGKAFFQFTPHPRNDTVDRWHIPSVLRARYDAATIDADRVSILNTYLYVTGRTPKSAKELGFTPTMYMPGLPEGGNEVGFGYALEGQHQYHCAEFLADAIEIGKANINNFYLMHTIHCLSLIKYFATRLTDPQPLTLLTPEAEKLIKAGIKQTID